MPNDVAGQNPFTVAMVVAAVLILFGFTMIPVPPQKPCPSNMIRVI